MTEHPHFQGLHMPEPRQPRPEPKQTRVRHHMVRITTEYEPGRETAGLAVFIEAGEEIPLGTEIVKAEDVASWGEQEPFRVDDHSMYEGLSEQMFRTMLNRGAQPTVGLRFLCMDLANLAFTGEPKFHSDTEPKDASIEDFGSTRDALTRILDAFYGRNGKDNTDLLGAMEFADRLLENNL